MAISRKIKICKGLFYKKAIDEDINGKKEIVVEFILANEFIKDFVSERIQILKLFVEKINNEIKRLETILENRKIKGVNR
jgi:hypothetical protein